MSDGPPVPLFQRGDVVRYVTRVVEGRYAWSTMPIDRTPIEVGTLGIVQCFIEPPRGGHGYFVQLMLAPNGVDLIERLAPVHYYKQ